MRRGSAHRSGTGAPGSALPACRRLEPDRTESSVHRDEIRADDCAAGGRLDDDIGASWRTGSATVSPRPAAVPSRRARAWIPLDRAADRLFPGPFCPHRGAKGPLSANDSVAFTLRSATPTLCGMTVVSSCGAGHKTAGRYPVTQITNRSRHVYMGPALLPKSARAMPANGSQVHEFAPPGPPPRRGIGTRHRVRFDPRHGPRNLAAAG
jgi:hypothetical protein